MSIREHIRLLAYLNIAASAIGILISIVLMTIFGGIGAFVLHEHMDKFESLPAVVAVVSIAGFICTLIAVLALPGLIAGVGLLKLQRWARVLTIVLSALNLLSIPVGTALGAYGLWVLLRPEAEQIFGDAPPSP